MKQESFDDALRLLQKYRKWHTGELDEWSPKHRVPPASTMRFILQSSENALKIASHFQFSNIDIGNPRVAMKIPSYRTSVYASAKDAEDDRKSDKFFFVPGMNQSSVKRTPSKKDACHPKTKRSKT